jgi:hypothetical protein
VESDQFDAVVRRWGTATRRTVFGLGLGSGLASRFWLVEAKKKKGKKKNKKKTCKGCTECQTCRKGKCQTQPVGSTCSTGACQEGEICSCTLAPDNCPTGCACVFLSSGEVTLCVQSEGISEGPLCATDAECGRGEKCVSAEYDPGPQEYVFRCAAVCGA